MPLPNICNDSRRQHDLRVSIRLYSATSFIYGRNWVIIQIWDMFLFADRRVSKDSKNRLSLRKCSSAPQLSYDFTLIGEKRSTRIVINLENWSRLNFGCRYVDSDVTQGKPYALPLSIRQRALKWRHCGSFKPLCCQLCTLKYGRHASFSVCRSSRIYNEMC
jgi:hypothetical protein